MKISDIITVTGITPTRGVVKEITSKKIKVLLNTTTTGVLSTYSLRNDGTFTHVGYSKDNAAFGGYFYLTD